MSTWGTGLFASDSAQDFLEELAELDSSDRSSELARLFRELLDNPSALMQTVFPEALIAAAALVALSMPGGRAVIDGESDFIADAVAEAALDSDASHLAPEAIRVLGVVTGPGGDWNRGWRRPEDREEALSRIETVKGILSSFRAE